jgi:hypothetical protein
MHTWFKNKIVEDLYTNTHSFPKFPYAASVEEINKKSMSIQPDATPTTTS